MSASLQSKLPDVGTTIFSVMSQLAAEHGAINLSQGYPDFDPPQALLDALTHAVQNGANQYAPMAGLPALCEVLGEKHRVLYGHEGDWASQITVTVGATEALFSAVQALVHAGDEVIVLDPAYDAYEPAVRLAGGSVRRVPLYSDDFSVDWQRVEEAIGPRTRLLMLNFPHNPTGAVLSREDLDTLEGLLERHSITLVSDEVYEHMVYDGRPHLSLLTRPALAARTVVVSSFGKTCHCTGWKIGYCTAPAPITEEIRKVHQFVPFAVSTPMQKALAEFTAQHPEHHEALPAFYQAKRDLFVSLLEGSRLTLTPTPSTYFQLVDYSALSELDDVAYARHLTMEVGVAAIPVSVFCESFDRRLVRFCFAKDDATLRQAAETLCQL
ncbi:MAG: methionine aminotransferase [Pseudomonadota bacterium]